MKCISDSGTIYPLHTHTLGCDPQLTLLGFFKAWHGISDESCMAEHPDGQLGCVRCYKYFSTDNDKANIFSATTAWPYLETKALLLHSSTDTTIRFPSSGPTPSS